MDADGPQPLPAGHYLSDLSPKDKPWDKHRAEALTVEHLYRQHTEFAAYADRIEQCSRRLQFALVADPNGPEGDLLFKLHAARFCRVRHCPVCQWRRSMMWRSRFFRALPQFMEAHPHLVPLFLTLTVRNCPLDELRQTVQMMHKAFTRLTQRKIWPGVGWVRSLEVTKGQDGPGQAHPHLHVLMFVKPGYFGKNYIKQSEWRSLWQSCLRVDYLPVVNIKRVKATADQGNDIRLAILETLKYGVKPEDLVAHGDWLYGITQQLHNTRSVAVGGELRPYLRESEPEDLIHDESLDEVEAEKLSQAPQIIFDYFEIVKRYARVTSGD